MAELIQNQGRLLERHCKVGILQVGCSCARKILTLVARAAIMVTASQSPERKLAGLQDYTLNPKP